MILQFHTVTAFLFVFIQFQLWFAVIKPLPFFKNQRIYWNTINPNLFLVKSLYKVLSPYFSPDSCPSPLLSGKSGNRVYIGMWRMQPVLQFKLTRPILFIRNTRHSLIQSIGVNGWHVWWGWAEKTEHWKRRESASF